MDENETPKPMGQVIQIDEARIRDDLGEMVRGTVEEALNAMLDAEVDRRAEQDATSAARAARTRVLEVTNDRWTPRPVR